MSVCRTCLKIPASKSISELEMGINEGNKSYFEIMMFCLDIKVTKDSKITMNLCEACYVKIISFYNFKTLSLKNDVYFKSLDPLVSIADKKPSVYVDEKGIKHENLLDSDEYGQSVVDEDDCSTGIKLEVEVKKEQKLEDVQDEDDTDSDKEPLSVIQQVKNENNKNGTKRNVKIPKKRGRPKKIKVTEVEHPKPGYQVCEECGKNVRNLKQHSARHQPKGERKMFKCDACPKTFCSRGARSEHCRIVHLGMKSICDICNKEVVYLPSHKATVHNKEALPHGCASCGRRFISQSALATHMITHTKDADAFVHECTICQKKFSSRGFLSRHMRQVHEKERNNQCEFCSKAFFTKYALERHISSHKNERPYKCEECGKSFSNSFTRKNHQLIHAGVKNVRCDICDMTFMRMEYLRKHMISHTKEKKYPCRYCGRRFGRTDHRRKHEITAHLKHLAAD